MSYIVPEGKTYYVGKRRFKTGEEIPPGLADKARENLEHSAPPLPPPPPPEE